MINNIEGGNVDLSDYYTKTEVDEKLSDVDVDLTGYYTAEQVDTEISNAIGAIEIPEVDLTDYALKTDIPDTSGFTTEEDVIALIAEHGGGTLPASEEGAF